MSATIIRVDWEAWAAAEAQQRAVCGPRGFMVRAIEREPKSEPTLPGMAAWLGARGLTMASRRHPRIP